MKILTEIMQAYKNFVQIYDGKIEWKIRKFYTVFPAPKDTKSDKTHPIF